MAQFIRNEAKPIFCSKPVQCLLLHPISISFLDCFFSRLNALHLHPASPHFVASGHDHGWVLPTGNWKPPGSCTHVLPSLPPTARLPWSSVVPQMMTIGFYSQELSFQTSSLWLWPTDSSSTCFPVLGDVRNLDLPDSKLLVFAETPLTCLLIYIISFTYRSIWAFEGSRPSTHICWVVLALTSSCFIAITDVLAQTMTLIGSGSLFQQRKRLRCSGRRHSGTQAPIKNWGEDFSALYFFNSKRLLRKELWTVIIYFGITWQDTGDSYRAQNKRETYALNWNE